MVGDEQEEKAATTMIMLTQQLVTINLLMGSSAKVSLFRLSIELIIIIARRPHQLWTLGDGVHKHTPTDRQVEFSLLAALLCSGLLERESSVGRRFACISIADSQLMILDS